MDMVFTIAGQALTAERLTMRGNTIEVDFAPEAAGVRFQNFLRNFEMRRKLNAG